MMPENETLDFAVFDFAFSFAGEDREIVKEIYNRLNSKGFSVFYDYAYQAQLVGKDLYTALRDLYKSKGKYVVCFISEHYAKKVWTNLEFTAIKERLMSTFFGGGFLIPIIIGETQMLEDIPSFIGFFRHESVDKTVQMLEDKTSASTIEDNFLSNINNFISYLCNQVYRILNKSNDEILLINNNEILVSGASKPFSLVFSPDPGAQAQCVLVRRKTQINGRYVTDAFPVFIVTWQKAKNLHFSINEFNSNTDNCLEKQSFYDVVQYICVYIRSSGELSYE